MYSFFVMEHIRILKLFQNILPTMVLFLDRRLTGISPIYFLDPLLFLLNATLFFSWLKCIGAAHHLLIWVCLYLRGHPRDPFSNPLQIRLRENSLLGRVLTLFMASWLSLINFLWIGFVEKKKKKKSITLAWSKCCLPLKKRGSGVKNLSLKNKAFFYRNLHGNLWILLHLFSPSCSLDIFETYPLPTFGM